MMTCAASCRTCDPCRADSLAPIVAVVRRTGPLEYLDRTEHVDSHPDSLGDPRDLIGKRIEGGRHGGPTIGKITAAERQGGTLRATMRIDSPDWHRRLRSGAFEFSAEYTTRTDAARIQRGTRFQAVAAIDGRSRCGPVCSVVRTDAAEPRDARQAMIARNRSRRSRGPAIDPVMIPIQVIEITREGSRVRRGTAADVPERPGEPGPDDAPAPQITSKPPARPGPRRRREPGPADDPAPRASNGWGQP